MRKLLYICLVIFAIFQIIKYVNAIQWRDDFDQAVKDAVAQHKPMMVYFYTDWCGFCRKFEGGVLCDWTVKKLAKQFICVKVNADKNKELASRYEVTGYPEVLFLDSNANVIAKHQGSGMGAKFSMKATMKNALRKIAGLPPLNEEVSVLNLF